MRFIKALILPILIIAFNGCIKFDDTSKHNDPTVQKPLCKKPLPKDEMVSDIVAGQFFSCDLRKGQVNCWGRIRPVPIMKNVTQIAGNSYKVCAITSEGIQCWGCISDLNGRCWDEEKPPHFKSPKEVSVGDRHSCAIGDEGVKCWGSNDLDQLNVPKELKNPHGITAGLNFTCVHTDAGLRCWGLGHKCVWAYQKECDESKEAAFQSFVSGIKGSDKVMLFGQNICAKSEDQFKCLNEVPRPQDLPRISNLTADVYGFHFCTTTPEGLRCWQAFGGIKEIVTPKFSSLTKVTGGYGHYCSIESGEAVCWGLEYPSSQDYGQTNSPESERPCDYEYNSPKPAPTPEPDPNIGLQCSPALSDSFCTGYNVGESCVSPQGVGICRSTGLTGPAKLPGCKCIIQR